jgi:hypothetical protein
MSTDFQLPLTFNNRPLPDDATVAGFIHVTAGDAMVPFRLISDPASPATILVAPAGDNGAGRWPAGTRLAVAVDVNLPDYFGVGLSAGGAGSFVTLAAGDDGANRCPPVADGGAKDGSVDASIDGSGDGSAERQDLEVAGEDVGHLPADGLLDVVEGDVAAEEARD